MRKRNTLPNSKKDRIRRESNPLSWRYCLLTLVCGLILVAGLFSAACQHFSAIGYGIKNAKLRQQKENLEAEQRRLYLTREILITPTEIKKAAKKIGLKEITATGIETVSQKISSINPFTKKSADEKLKQASIANSKESNNGKETNKQKNSSEKGNKEIKSAKAPEQSNSSNRLIAVRK